MRGGTHASTYTNLSPHSHTYARDTCKFSSDSDVVVAFLRRNPDLCTLGSSTPLDVPLTGVARRSYLLFCVFLGHRVMRNHVGSQVGALSYLVSSQRGDSPLYGSGTFASRLERMHAGGAGGHMQEPIPNSHHTHTHILGTHASFHLIPMFSWPSSGETLICAPSDRLPPRRSSDRGSPA